jgi:hypothetical protein
MGADRFQVIKSTGDRGLDEELRRLLGRTSAVETAVAASSAAAQGATGAAGQIGPAGPQGPTGTFAAQLVSADPVSPAAGAVWFRTDTGYLCVWDGAYVWKVLLAHA